MTEMRSLNGWAVDAARAMRPAGFLVRVVRPVGGRIVRRGLYMQVSGRGTSIDDH